MVDENITAFYCSWYEYQGLEYYITYNVYKFSCFFVVSGGTLLSAGTISSPWTAVTGPAADANGPGPDTKNLDVGDMSDVSAIILFINQKSDFPRA